MKQLEIDLKSVRFNGSDYDPLKDNTRLTGQILRIFNLMKDGEWRTLADIEQKTGDPQASISAQLRHLRKARFGGFKVIKSNLSGGLFRYKVIK